MHSVLIMSSLVLAAIDADLQALRGWNTRHPELSFTDVRLAELATSPEARKGIGPLTFDAPRHGGYREVGFVSSGGIFADFVRPDGIIVAQRKRADVQVIVDHGGERYSLRGQIRSGRWWFTSVQKSKVEGSLPTLPEVAMGLRIAECKPEWVAAAIRHAAAEAAVQAAAQAAMAEAKRENEALASIAPNLPPAPMAQRVNSAVAAEKARQAEALRNASPQAVAVEKTIAALEKPAVSGKAAKSAAIKAAKSTPVRQA